MYSVRNSQQCSFIYPSPIFYAITATNYTSKYIMKLTYIIMIICFNQKSNSEKSVFYS